VVCTRTFPAWLWQPPLPQQQHGYTATAQWLQQLAASRQWLYPLMAALEQFLLSLACNLYTLSGQQERGQVCF
jgi:hypothetical protein